MKHPLNTTLLLIVMFFLSQIIGILVINSYIGGISETGELEYKALPLNQERPEVENKSISFLYISIAVFIGTLILLGLIKLRLYKIWKIWFFLAIWMTLTIAFATFLQETIATILAAILAIWKIWKPNVYIHNFTELFVYAGISAFIVPIFNILAISILLIIISIYDYWAVFKSKHMVKLAKASAEAKIFPGLHIGYGKNKKTEKKNETITKRTIKATRQTQKIIKKTQLKVNNMAVLGGGDIAFALLFTGTALTSFYGNPLALTKALIISIFSTLGIASLFFLAKKGKFYPAMPFVSIGCFLGYGFVLLI
jgi:presenilin-like A22 family membrane protease